MKHTKLFREEESSCQRLGKVQGYATLNCLETLLVVQAEKSNLKKATYEHFQTYSTLSNMLGPIVMPPFDQVGVCNGRSRRNSTVEIPSRPYQEGFQNRIWNTNVALPRGNFLFKGDVPARREAASKKPNFE